MCNMPCGCVCAHVGVCNLQDEIMQGQVLSSESIEGLQGCVLGYYVITYNLQDEIIAVVMQARMHQLSYMYYYLVYF